MSLKEKYSVLYNVENQITIIYIYMKKTLRIILLSIATILLLIILTAIAVPVLFKEKIKTQVEQSINESVNAIVSFGDYKLGFFRDFPNISFSLGNLTVIGVEKFENDTLASVKSINLVLNLPSLFRKTGIEVKSIIVEDANVRTVVLNDGSANWDIMKETEEESPAGTESTSDFKILLKKVSLINSSLLYTDHESDINITLYGINSELTGDLTASETDLFVKLGAEQLNYSMEGMKYLDKAKLYTELNLLADLDKYKFTFRENFLALNDLKVLFSGWVSMPEEDIETDLEFRSEQNSFKTLLSLVPAFYMKDFSELRADGEFSLSGSAKGVYSDADSTLPDIALNLQIRNGSVKYPSLPEQITGINLSSNLSVDGRDMDKTTLDINTFHMEVAGNPFNMSLALKTPVSDPEIKGSVIGKINLDALSKALPLDSIGLSGLIDLSLEMDGRLSMIEKKHFEKFKASGSMVIQDMQVGMKNYPEVKISSASFEFTPAYAEMKQAILGIGRNSDFDINGRLENYIPYILRNDVIRGNLNLRSKLIDLSEIMSKLGAETEDDDTTSLSVITVPENIDFDFTALIDEFRYGRINASNVKGHIVVRNGTVNIRETGMNILGGQVSLNALYDTRDTLKPVVKAELTLQNMGIKEAFNTFNTVQKLAPAAKGVDGKMSAKFSYSSLLRKDFMPVISTITGGGKLESEEVKLIESASFDRMKEVLKLRSDYTNVFRDINVSFKINDGRIYVSPFNTRVGNIKMNISGDQGIDQTLNYVVKTEIPRAELGTSVNSLIDNMSAQAAMFGIAFKPAEIMKINVKVTGTFGKPAITPFFGDTPAEGSPTLKETATDAARQLVDDAADKAREKARTEAQMQGDRLVQEAEEKASQMRDEAARLAERIRKEGDEQAQKLLKEAESRGTVAKMAAGKGAEKIKSEAEKRAQQVIKEADEKAAALVDEAKSKREELINKL